MRIIPLVCTQVKRNIPRIAEYIAKKVDYLTNYTLLAGDCLERLRDLPDNSVDSVVTDPPYGLSKEPDIAEVLTKWIAGEPYDHKHGGFMGKAWDSFVPHPDIWREVYRVLKPGGHALVFAGTRTQDLMTVALRLSGFEVRDVIEWLYFSGFPKSMDVGKAFDRRRDEDKPHRVRVTSWVADQCAEKGFTRRKLCEIWGVKNQPIQSWTERNADYAVIPTWTNWLKLKAVVGFGDEMDAEVWRLNGRKGCPGDAYQNAEVTGVQKGAMSGWDMDGGTKFLDREIKAPATDLARRWDGWGTALKPAHEPIIVVRKPLIDAETGRKLTVADCVEKYGTGAVNIDGARIGERFPANSVTTDADAFYSEYFNVTPAELSKKAAKKDRNSDWQGAQVDAGNRHPTVKPTDLMAWLVRLVTPPGGTTLDPFAGSGSTLVAARREGFGFIGIEREHEYVEIIEARAGVSAR